MTADIVVNMPTSLEVRAKRIATICDRREKITDEFREEWVRLTLELAVELAEARERFSSNIKFSIWLAENGLDGKLLDNDRAALINMARNFDFSRIVLQETERTSVQYIWLEEIRPRLPYVRKKEEIAEIPEKPAETQEVEQKKESHEPIQHKPAKPSPASKTPAHKSDDVTSNIYTHQKTRQLFKNLKDRRAAKEILELAQRSVEAGFLTEADKAFQSFTAYMLFPNCPLAFGSRYKLLDRDQRQEVTTRIMPAAIARKEEILKEPHRIEVILAEYWQNERSKAVSSKANILTAALPEGQARVVIHGKILWPIVHPGDNHDYDQLCAAAWYFRDMRDWMRQAKLSVGSEAIYIRQSVRWYTQALDRKFPPGDPHRAWLKTIFQLVSEFATLMEKSPEGETILPEYENSHGW